MEQTQCKNCVMDKSAKEISFDADGVCNFCIQAQKSLREIESEKHKLPEIISQIKKDRGEYDVLIGLSGGVDSSFVLHNAIKLGLRPLCFSVDNGWNDPRADENIMKLVEGLKVPFYRYVIDLDKFRELQMAFLRAGLINAEIPTDHILMAVSLEIANEYGIKYILSGGNVSTESIMPASWSYSARDLVHIKDVHKWATNKKLKGLPVCGLLRWNWFKWVKRIKTIYLLDYLDYNRHNAILSLQEEYRWNDYGAKHEESAFTMWFQNWYLFEKFGIDKRKAHLSSLINSREITRDEALNELGKNPIYPRLGIEKKVMKYPKQSHYDFKTDEWLFNLISKVVKLCRF